MTPIDEQILRKLAQGLQDDATEKPSKAVDNAILMAATTAASTFASHSASEETVKLGTSSSVTHRQRRNWQTPVSVAACMVLCFGILNTLPQPGDELIEYRAGTAEVSGNKGEADSAMVGGLIASSPGIETEEAEAEPEMEPAADELSDGEVMLQRSAPVAPGLDFGFSLGKSDRNNKKERTQFGRSIPTDKSTLDTVAIPAPVPTASAPAKPRAVEAARSEAKRLSEEKVEVKSAANRPAEFDLDDQRFDNSLDHRPNSDAVDWLSTAELAWTQGKRSQVISALQAQQQLHPKFKLTAWVKAQGWELSQEEWAQLGVTPSPK